MMKLCYRHPVIKLWMSFAQALPLNILFKKLFNGTVLLNGLVRRNWTNIG